MKVFGQKEEINLKVHQIPRKAHEDQPGEGRKPDRDVESIQRRRARPTLTRRVQGFPLETNHEGMLDYGRMLRVPH